LAAIAIVPAAGKAERFGGGKLTADINGEPLLTHTLRSLLDGGAASIIVIVAPDAALESVSLLEDPRITRVVNPDPSRGMFSSIQIGFAQAAEGHPILVLPGDMPFVMSETVAAILEAARSSGRIVLPRYEGRHGHPVAVPSSLTRAILAAGPETTLAGIIKSHAHASLDLDVADPGVRRDVDVHGDLTRPA
jgi:molybdenum cofactor cytidylyltransferase